MRTRLLLFQLLNLGYLRSHVFRTLLNVAAVAIGVTMVFGILILNDSLPASYARSNQTLLGVAQLEVTTNATAGLDERLADELRSLPNVRTAAPLLLAPAQLGPLSGANTAEVTVIGFDSSVLRLSPAVLASNRVHAEGPAPGLAVPRQVLDELHAGSAAALRLQYLGRATPVPVAGIVPADVAGQLNGGHFVGLPLPLAQQALSLTGRVTTILVDAADRSPGAVSALQRRLRAAAGPGALVEPLSLRLRQFDASFASVQSLSTFVSVVALMVGAYLVFNTMSMAAVERRRQVAILLAIGESPARLVGRFLTEAGLLGSAGTLIGLGAGLGLGDFLVQSSPRYLEDAYGFRASVVVTPSVLLPAVAAGLGATLLATLLPAQAFRRVPPAEAVRPWEAGHVTSSPRLLWAALAAGLLLGGAGVVASLALPGLAIAFIAVVLVGAVLAGPALFLGAIAFLARLLLGSPLRHWAGLTRLAGANLQRSPGRIVATVSACTFSLAMVVAIGGEVDGIQASVHRFADRFGNFDLYVAATDDSYASVPLPPAAADLVRAEPGVAAVHPFRSTFVTWRDRRLYLEGEDAAAIRELGVTFHSGNPSAAVASLDGDGMLVSTQVAQLDHVGLGDPVTIAMPDGPRTFHVSGVIDELSWPEGTMMIGSAAFTGGLQAPGINQLLVKLSPGADPATVESRLGSVLPGTVIRTGRGLVSTIASQQAAQVAPFLQVRNVAVLVAALTVLNSLFLAVLGRSREIGVERAIGALGRDVAAALLLEASAMLAVALVAGAALGVGLQALGTQFLVSTAGLPVRWSLDPPQLLAGCVAAAVTVVLGSLYPARLASRVPVLEAIRYE